jgi:hypothetical protein
MALALASELGGSALLSGSWLVPQSHLAPAEEASAYAAVADRLGLSALGNVSSLLAARPGLLQLSRVGPLQAATVAAAACNAGARDVLLLLDADSCPLWRRRWHALFVDPPSTWCPLDPRVPGLDDVAWQLRKLGSATRSSSPPPLLHLFDERALNVALHVRNGDVCVNCEFVNEHGLDYGALLETLRKALRGCRVRFVFFAQLPLAWAEALPDARMVTAHEASVDTTAAHLLGADVLVTGGSSFATALVAFAGAPDRPVVLEAMTKESSWGCHNKGCPGRTHVLAPGFSVRLDRTGGLGITPAELRARIAVSLPESWARACDG